MALRLFVNNRLIAWFYHKTVPASLAATFSSEPGAQIEQLSRHCIESEETQLSDWHLAVMRAFLRGAERAAAVRLHEADLQL